MFCFCLFFLQCVLLLFLSFSLSLSLSLCCFKNKNLLIHCKPIVVFSHPRNRYKKAMKKVLRYCVELEHYDKQPDSHQQVMDEVKGMLDEACEIIDEVTVQGVLHRNTAAKRKDWEAVVKV